MRLYHASFMPIPNPDLKYSRTNVDFGRGFYTTPIRSQALNWCGKFKRRGMPGVISRYQFDETAYETLKILRFETYSEQWLDFILTCRIKQTNPIIHSITMQFFSKLNDMYLPQICQFFALFIPQAIDVVIGFYIL